MGKIRRKVEFPDLGTHPDPEVLELQRLVLCYQEASSDDKITIWSVLNKYASKIDKL